MDTHIRMHKCANGHTRDRMNGHTHEWIHAGPQHEACRFRFQRFRPRQEASYLLWHSIVHGAGDRPAQGVCGQVHGTRYTVRYVGTHTTGQLIFKISARISNMRTAWIRIPAPPPPSSRSAPFPLLPVMCGRCADQASGRLVSWRAALCVPVWLLPVHGSVISRALQKDCEGTIPTARLVPKAKSRQAKSSQVKSSQVK